MKIKLFTIIILLVLPVSLFFTVSCLKPFQGPYFYGTNADPDYVYLLNSLNIARLKLPGHIDHPGTPTQIIGAITLRFTHLISGSGKIVDDVLSRPETYLQTLNIVFLWLTILALFISGWFVWLTFGKIEMAILFQLAPYFTATPEYLLKVSTEPILIISCLMFSALVCRVFIKEDLEEKKHNYILSFAILSAFGMATKITFFPLLLIPFLLLKRRSDRLSLLLQFAITFFILAYPVIFRLSYFWKWIRGLFWGAGMYGGGKPTVIDSNTFFQNLYKIVATEFTFDIILLNIIILFTGFFFYSPLKTYRKKHPVRFQVTGLSLLVFVIYLVIVAKHYHFRYMIPPVLFSVVPLLGLASVIQEVFLKRKYGFLIYALFLIAFVGTVTYSQVYSFKQTVKTLNYHLTGQNELREIINNKYPSGFKIYSYGSSTPQQAFSLAIGYTHHEQSTYLEILKNTYPNSLFFSPWDKGFYEWVFINDVNIEEVLAGNNEVYINCLDLIEHGVISDNKLPIVDPAGEPTGKFLYLTNLNKEGVYREALYKVIKIGE